jgi:hypothetical protein
VLRGHQPRSQRAVIRPIRVCDLSGIEGWDWLSYLTVKYQDIPEVEIVLINRPELGYLGAGEASLVPVPAVIANAIFDPTGPHVHGRIQHFPSSRTLCGWPKINRQNGAVNPANYVFAQVADENAFHKWGECCGVAGSVPERS